MTAIYAWTPYLLVITVCLYVVMRSVEIIERGEASGGVVFLGTVVVVVGLATATLALLTGQEVAGLIAELLSP